MPSPINDSPSTPASTNTDTNTETRTVGLYPHDMHPGLVPGIGVENQRNTFGLDKALFSVTAIAVVSFIIWGILSPESVSAASSSAAQAKNNLSK